MTSFVLLLRGINVGGKNIIKMKELKAVLESLSLQNVQTYIQSGNVVFRANDKDNMSNEISNAISKAFEFEPKLMLIKKATFTKAIRANPFPDAVNEPKSLHLYFLTAVPKQPDLNLLHDLAKESERFKLIGDVFYLHAPEGIGRSKLAERVEKSLGVSATARNWRTVSKLNEMLHSFGVDH